MSWDRGTELILREDLETILIAETIWENLRRQTEPEEEVLDVTGRSLSHLIYRPKHLDSRKDGLPVLVKIEYYRSYGGNPCEL